MSIGTNDKDSRRTSNKIMSQEEYEEAKVKLEQYKAEYEWIRDTDKETAIREINAEAQKIRGMINGERSNEQLYYLCYYNELVVKKYLVENEQYLAIMSEKIKSLVAKIKQFEIDSKDYSLKDIVRSWIGRDDETKEAIKMNRMLSRVRVDGLSRDTNLSLQSPEQIIAYFKKYGDFVGIELPEPETQTTELAISEGYLTKAQRDYYDFINQTILGNDEKNGIGFAESDNKGEKRDNSVIREVIPSHVETKKATERKQERTQEGKDRKFKNDEGEISQ